MKLMHLEWWKMVISGSYSNKTIQDEINENWNNKILKSANVICFDDYYSLDYILQYCVKGVFWVPK